MAVYSERDRRSIDDLCVRWREQSLVGDASLLYPDEFTDCWSLPVVSEMNERFWGNVIPGSASGGKFESKWEVQLSGASAEVRLLAAECLLVYYLFTETVGPGRKLQMINNTIGPDLPEVHVTTDSPAHEPLRQWIANPGQRYNTRQDLQIGYLIDFCRRLKMLAPDQRAVLLHDDPWGLGEFADDTDRPGDAMRHVVCHLLYPEQFERISSIRHKELILRAFGDLDTSGEESGQDEKLYSIRQSLRARLPAWGEQRRDYYRSDLAPIWKPIASSAEDSSLDPVFALEFKKQIVFYGPPGTGKTFRAAGLGESIIRSAALKRWGVSGYFNDVPAADRAVADHITRVQLHPSVGYEEFMVGLRLDGDGGTRYQIGLLPRIMEQMRAEREEQGDRALPHVLILDEINRTDLSAMFGEAFSLMERDKRDVEIDLFADDQGNPIKFAIPHDLYIIGTMNEIDQSVEALDFALRRRFFWFRTPFDAADLEVIWDVQWRNEVRSVDRSDAGDQLEQLAGCISQLNARIRDLPELGPEYELGAAVFGDLPYFINREWPRQRRRGGRVLWDTKGKALAPLRSLWSLSIEPVLAQYLAGSDRRATQLAELQQVLTDQPKP